MKIKCIKNYITNGIEFKKGIEYMAIICSKANDYYISVNGKPVYVDLNDEDEKSCFVLV